MHKIVLTGGIASGKSEAVKIFQEYGVPVLDADKIAHNLLKKNTPAYKQIVEHFGKDYILDNGQINRPMLGKLIFSNQVEKTWLENLLHPLILQEIRNQLQHLEQKKNKTKYCIIDVPLYAEIVLSNNHPHKEAFKKLADKVLVIDTEESIQKNRLFERYNRKNIKITEDEIKAILSAQLSRLDRNTLADNIIKNDLDLSSFKKNILKIHQLYSDRIK
jgi:dephospho-CoA kinase